MLIKLLWNDIKKKNEKKAQELVKKYCIKEATPNVRKGVYISDKGLYDIEKELIENDDKAANYAVIETDDKPANYAGIENDDKTANYAGIVKDDKTAIYAGILGVNP